MEINLILPIWILTLITEFLVEFIRVNVNSLMFSETNIYEIINSLVDSFNAPFNRNSNVGGIMLFLPEDKPAKLIASKHL